MSERAIRLPKVSAAPSERRAFIGGSDARVIMGSDEPALLRLWREKRGEAEPEDLSGNPRPTQPCDRAGTKSSTSPIRAAHAEFVAALARHCPHPIPLDPNAVDLEDRADHLKNVFAALSLYVSAILDDTAQNVPGRLDLDHIDAVLSDLASDVIGTIRHAAEGMAGRIA
jgi:hypothetical protein